MDPAAERRSRYEALVTAVVEPMRRYALRRTDHASAEDVVAEALLVIWRRLDDVPAGGELPWCYAVTRRCLANSDRSRRRRTSLVARIALLDRPGDGAADEPVVPDPAVHQALRRLPIDDREVLRLWAWEDLRPAEIAEVLGITPNAVSIRLHRAKGRLATALGRPEPGATATPGAEASVGGKGHHRAGQIPVDDPEDSP